MSAVGDARKRLAGKRVRDVESIRDVTQWIRDNLPLDNLGHVTSCSAFGESCGCSTLPARLAARLAEARAEERERAAWEVQRVINHWSSVPADVLAERAAELADLEACRDRIARSEAGA